MNNKFIFLAIGLLIALLVSFIVFDIFKFKILGGSILSGLIVGLILNILYKNMKI